MAKIDAFFKLMDDTGASDLHMISGQQPVLRVRGESMIDAGILDGVEISRDEAEHLIMQARVKAGWISEADLARPAEDTDEDAEAEGDDEGEADDSEAGAAAPTPTMK